MAYGAGVDPRNGLLVTGQTVSGAGLLLTGHDGGSLLRVTAASNSEIAIGVSCDSSERTLDGALATAAGSTCNFYPMGGVLLIASEALTWVAGDIAYASGDGRCDKTSSSQKAIGIYVGTGETAAAGDLVAINTNSAVVA
jgi:hypothetical protein